MVGDELRYFEHAKKYFGDIHNIELLWNGPFYPILIRLLSLFGQNKLLVVSVNFISLLGSVILIYRTIRHHVHTTPAYWLSLFFAGYTLICPEFSKALTEALSVFLFTAMVSLSLSIIEHFSKTKFVFLSICMTILCLIKVIFGYIFLAYAVTLLILSLLKNDSNIRKLSLAPILAIVLCIPYLAHTYSMTGKTYYWSTAGGLQLYWMTATSPHEYGDWNNMTLSVECFKGSIFCNRELWAKNHEEIVNHASKLDVLQMDEFLKTTALENIRAKPFKYIKNIIANMGRMIFGYPYSYSFQTMGGLFRILINALFIFPLLLSILLLAKDRIPKFESTIFLLAFGYFVASSLVSAYPRQFYPIIPALLIFMALSISKSIKLKT